jgi:ParB family chromosome partitioning protein
VAGDNKNIPDAGKVVGFTAVREGAAKGKPPEKTTAPDKGKQVDKVKDAVKLRRGRPPKADKAAADKAKPQPRDKMSPSSRAAGCTACG